MCYSYRRGKIVRSEKVIIELDTVVSDNYGPSIDDAACVITANYDVTFTVVTVCGSGGSAHAVIRYEGDARELRRMVKKHYGPATANDVDVDDDARWLRRYTYVVD
jgi:hypothetical protein